MNGHEFPIVKITLQGMEHSIVHAMTDHLAKVDDACAKAVKDAVESFDYASEVRRMTHQLIQEGIKRALERELSYGVPYEMVKKVAGQMVQEALAKVAA